MNILQRIFTDHYEEIIYTLHPRKSVIQNVDKMISCGDPSFGGAMYGCPHCGKLKCVPFRCHSRFCPTCGNLYSMQRTVSMSSKLVNVSHRHCIFTIDKNLRQFFLDDRTLLDCLFHAVNSVVSRMFFKLNKSMNFTPGFIMVLHTFGRDLKWNPHVHVLCTEGGMNKDHVYKAAPYINYASLRKSFMKQVMDKMRDSLPKDSKEQKQFRKLMSIIYNEKTNGFYVHAPPREMQKNNGKDQVVQYMIRYAGKPAMAQSRIISYNYHSRMIRYYYEDHKTNERVEVEESVFRFMLKLIRHIPQPQFKMVRYYGIYAACDHKHKQAVKQRLLKQNRFKKYHDRPKHYRLSLIDTFGVDPLLCTCGSYMEFVDSYVSPRFVAGGEPP